MCYSEHFSIYITVILSIKVLMVFKLTVKFSLNCCDFKPTMVLVAIASYLNVSFTDLFSSISLEQNELVR